MLEVRPPSKMLKELIKTKEWILDILWPKMCLGCGREGAYICRDCEIFLSEVEITEVRPQSIMSVWEYEGLMEKLILKIKYDGCYDIINELVALAFKKIDLNLPKDAIITFVPMYKKKEKRRGFNQAELIAKKVGESTGKLVVRLLEKIKDNRSQMDLNVPARISNTRDVFRTASFKKNEVRSVLLVDDFYTTGATIAECVRILKSGGVKNVFSFTLARQSVVRTDFKPLTNKI